MRREKMSEFYQQGDVIIERIDELPKDLVKLDGHVIEEGETPGHFHELAVAEPEKKQVMVYEDTEHQKYMQNFINTMLTHQEHKAIEIPPGTYRIRKVMEYDHLQNQQRPVID
jgi:hypothetical protein